jgi:2-keto-4-pentenoate hydratase/2-oxohepta-3-ene-1,7-dioic acid hydratase in catechol pathway
MSICVLRTAEGWWSQTPAGAAKIATSATSTRELLADREAVEAAARSAHTVPAGGLTLLSPVTAPCRVVAQMANYASHAKDVGLDPKTLPLSFFRKSSGSISGPGDDVITPEHVRLLDYEAEIGLVIGRELPVGAMTADWTSYVAGLVVANDISARDVQLVKTQFYESKSYPTFTPLGPRLVLLEPEELRRFEDLRVRLRVNGSVRQDALVGPDMLYKPGEALAALARFQRLDVGDVVLSGTPAGTALSAPPKAVEKIGALLPANLKWRLFFARQEKNQHYLRDGDIVEASVATDDGAIDLGAQRVVVRSR